MDVSIDKGGALKPPKLPLIKNQLLKHDIIHYCVPNIGSRVSRTLVTTLVIFFPLLIEIADSKVVKS